MDSTKEEYNRWKKELENITSQIEDFKKIPQNQISENAKQQYQQLLLQSNKLSSLINEWDIIHMFDNQSTIMPTSDNLFNISRGDIPDHLAYASPRNHGGKVKVYTGPKNGKYIIKNGSKVYIDSKSLSNNVQYIKKAKSKKK
jgi:hypothetical protein